MEGFRARTIRLFGLLMEEDPSNRPNAAAVHVTIKQFEQQYQNQNQTRIVAKTRN
jgi:hypothetical protein